MPGANLAKLELEYGDDTKLDITGMISDYSNFNNSNLRADLRMVQTNQTDLEALIKVWAPDYSSVHQLVALGDVGVKLTAFGKLNQFRYNGNVKTEQGSVDLNGLGRIKYRF